MAFYFNRTAEGSKRSGEGQYLQQPPSSRPFPAALAIGPHAEDDDGKRSVGNSTK